METRFNLVPFHSKIPKKPKEKTCGVNVDEKGFL